MINGYDILTQYYDTPIILSDTGFCQLKIVNAGKPDRKIIGEDKEILENIGWYLCERCWRIDIWD